MTKSPLGNIHRPFWAAVRCLASCRKMGRTKLSPSCPMATTTAVINPYR